MQNLAATRAKLRPEGAQTQLMDQASAYFPKSLELYFKTLSATLITAIVMAIIAPHGFSWLPAGLAIVSLLAAPRPLFGYWLKHDSLKIKAAACFLVWALFCAALSPEVAYAFFVVCAAAIVLASGYINLVYIRAFGNWNKPTPQAILVAYVVLNVILILIFFDIFSFAFIRGARGAIHDAYNRAACIAAIATPIALASLRAVVENRVARILAGAGLTLLAAVMSFSSASESAKAALCLTVVAQLVVSMLPRIGPRIIWSGIGLMFAMPFIVDRITSFVLMTPWWSYKPGTFAARLTLWTALKPIILTSPIIGNGVEHTRNTPIFNPFLRIFEAYTHPHSIFVQIWVDLGALGVILFVIALAIASRSWRNLPTPGSALLYAMLVGALAVSSVSDGMWQTWWIGFLTLYFLLGYALKGNMSERRRSAASIAHARDSPDQVARPIPEMAIPEGWRRFRIVGDEAMKEIGKAALLSILCQVALIGAFILRAGVDVAIARLGDGKLSAAMLAAGLLVFLLDRSGRVVEITDERRSLVNWIWIALEVACLWLALAFMAGALGAVPRSIPFLFAWILVSLGCLLDVARNRGRASSSGDGH